MNKTELVEKIAAGAGISKVDAKKALDAAVVAIKDALIAGDKVALVGFGTFICRKRAPRSRGYQPRHKGQDYDCCQESGQVQGRCRAC